ncbi:hypothetical protein N7539_005262 [Penicillium diatomitis]|uniref:ABC transporter domain-containing protein n=1 Tax=Penicillium diatomitis TaxID=2819901 RepID=A0A9W9X6J1_9EURO|nr:uncharacterized protein N7539_005262 [Penicillium diatomitis]KAJ5485274.1 hypothetical protein N7539_005262 [Penicillium diatomitis]
MVLIFTSALERSSVSAAEQEANHILALRLPHPAAKSTLAVSLLRLHEIASGQILIDGHDIAQKSRSSNADPLNQTCNAQIIDALRSVGVWGSLVNGSSGVDAKQATEEECLVSTLDKNVLSQGQKQLFCLARALLKKSKILILDEPTSSARRTKRRGEEWKLIRISLSYSLDHESDAKVQRIIRESFQVCTVIMVAHRIHSLLDFDQVAVLNSGRLVEVGHPQQLVNRSGSEFAKSLSLES